MGYRPSSPIFPVLGLTLISSWLAGSCAFRIGVLIDPTSSGGQQWEKQLPSQGDVNHPYSNHRDKSAYLQTMDIAIPFGMLFRALATLLSMIYQAKATADYASNGQKLPRLDKRIRSRGTYGANDVLCLRRASFELTFRTGIA